MERYRLSVDATGREVVSAPDRGARLLRNPMLEKGTAFTREEPAALGLEGLLPDAVSTLEQQERRVYRNILRREDPLERHVAREVTAGMFLAAADQLAAEVRDDDLAAGALFPRLSRVRDVEAAAAAAVARRALHEGVAGPLAEGEIPAAVRGAMWKPEHPAVEPGD
jgi:uncharacterized membrane protein